MPKNRSNPIKYEKQRKRTATNKIKRIKKELEKNTNERHQQLLKLRLEFWEKQLSGR